MNHDPYIVKPGDQISLIKDYNPGYRCEFHPKTDAIKKLKTGVLQLAKYQDVLYAQNSYSLLIIFQAMDAAGKDSTIKHVMSGVNPQGCQVFSFKSPSEEELDHDYLWRSMKSLPERGRIGIFNRSYYEELLIVRVHPEILKKQQLPKFPQGNQIWKQRFEEINNFEKYLVNNGVIVLKFFLNVSKSVQRKRFLARIDSPEKHWKFSASDIRERAFWDDYMDAYEQVFNNTSTELAPWYIVPADRKWFTRLVVADIICTKLQELNLQYPEISEENKKQLQEAKKNLEAEN
ncbi:MULTISPECIES: polyphosphate kinase 2 family protein [Nostocales]|jgi:PPK2 family polyphosphate:nucleotide phosphotransferase|uniref:Polyphosphate kinase 2 family protein n=3 Tax=Aphanizomenonaceae TaxID=1892259 RepID=A0ACC7S956_DOLFA|nr:MULTISPECIES: polyphosphate kinase 2 family protein [Nostocales]MBO1068971.1 polyphosphate kinase 2 family protein [Dolichospermum sp. DEX189]MCX5981592.1 polyphosphate kinase 2 family protein [Nostocales cyanobacterium LacPavin_0920_SED1_MAG_38_18]MDK2411963.1 polyphosphate kinase 2 family protein [Aphanizomenon sp. 202]MDK2461797.1 polyphosphate kinase 2 family protein [Aphanizomenon sp. PH219]QSV70160.1 MAG: polyphosphate kinase 2 family protein [Aphanizomenon flos-aquae KM1D3_PB]